MSLTQVLHEFLDPSGSIPTRELKINRKLLNNYFEGIDMDYNSRELNCIEAKLFETIECRLTGKQEEFLKQIGVSQYETRISPREYLFDKKHLHNIIAIAMHYHQILYDLWIHPYNENITKDIKLLKKDFEKIKTFLSKIDLEHLNVMTQAKHKIVLRMEPHYLEIESHKFTDAILDFLNRCVSPEKYSKQIKSDKKVSKLLGLIKFDIKKYGDTGRGKNYEVHLTQIFTWLLYSFVKDHKIITSLNAKGGKVSDRLYYSFIADIYSLIDLPPMQFGDGERLSWSFLPDQYNKEGQIKRIQSWVYNFQKKTRL